MAKKKPTFEEALTELERIAEEIERGQIGLEESIDRYEEGMKLVRHCREVLTKAEHRIQELQERANGTLTARDMEFPDNGDEGPSDSQSTPA